MVIMVEQIVVLAMIMTTILMELDGDNDIYLVLSLPDHQTIEKVQGALMHTISISCFVRKYAKPTF